MRPRIALRGLLEHRLWGMVRVEKMEKVVDLGARNQMLHLKMASEELESWIGGQVFIVYGLESLLFLAVT